MGLPGIPQASVQRDLNFKVIKFLGKGSYGSVFQVQRLSDRQEYALKEMDVRAMNQAEREDAVNEIRLLASVAHPNVISYNEAFLDGNRLCIIMEFAPDGDLAKVIKKHQLSKKPMPEELVWRFFIQIARGLQALHNMKILHRDVKPGNIMVMAGNVAKIGDLGISKLLKHTMAKTQIGTPHYMPPEVWKNRPYGFSSDSWAMGCILYEMATFSVPFEAKSMNELRYKVLRGTYPPISSSYSKELHEMVKTCMDQNPDRRPTMSQILNTEAVQKRLHLLPSESRAKPPSSASSVMLNTIKVPRNIQLIKGQLPGPVYPGMAGIGGMATVQEEEDEDSFRRHLAEEAAVQPKLPPLVAQHGGGQQQRVGALCAAPPPPPVMMSYGGAPPPLLPKGGGAAKSVYAIAQNYGLPLPVIKANAPRGYEPDDPPLYNKPRPPVVQTKAMLEQQHSPAIPVPWHQQPSRGGVSESHSAYGAFYKAPAGQAVPASRDGASSAASNNYPYARPNNGLYNAPQLAKPYGGGLPSYISHGGVAGGGGNQNGVGGGGGGGAKLPVLGAIRQGGESASPNRGGPQRAPPPWNFAAGKARAAAAAAAAAAGPAANRPGWGRGNGGEHYASPQWAKAGGGGGGNRW